MVQQSRNRPKSKSSTSRGSKRRGSKSRGSKSRGSKSTGSKSTGSTSKSRKTRLGHRKLAVTRKVQTRNPSSCNIYQTRSFIKKSALTTRARKYNIHFNWSTPFEVVANIDGINIYYNETRELIMKITNFVGFWAGYDSEHKQHGNSILVMLTNHNYIYIGNVIYKFMMNDEILDYYSSIDNNDIPNPLAVGSTNLYFLSVPASVDEKWFERKICPSNTLALYFDFFEKRSKSKQLNHKMIASRVLKRSGFQLIKYNRSI